MWVTGRKIGEQVTFGEGINQVVLTVLDIKGTQVRLGVDADKSVKISKEIPKTLNPKILPAGLHGWV